MRSGIIPIQKLSLRFVARPGITNVRFGKRNAWQNRQIADPWSGKNCTAWTGVEGCEAICGASRLSVLSSGAGRHVFRTETCRSDKSERPEPRCLRRYRHAWTMHGRSGSLKTPRFECAYRRKSKFFRPTSERGAGARDVVPFENSANKFRPRLFDISWHIQTRPAGIIREIPGTTLRANISSSSGDFYSFPDLDLTFSVFLNLFVPLHECQCTLCPDSLGQRFVYSYTLCV